MEKYIAPGVYKATEDLDFILELKGYVNTRRICVAKGYYLFLGIPEQGCSYAKVEYAQEPHDQSQRKSHGEFDCRSISEVLNPLLNEGKLELIRFSDPYQEVMRREEIVSDWVNDHKSGERIKLLAQQACDYLKDTVDEALRGDGGHFTYTTPANTKETRLLIINKDKEFVKITLEGDELLVIRKEQVGSLEFNETQWASMSTRTKVSYAYALMTNIKSIRNNCDKVRQALPLVAEYALNLRYTHCAKCDEMIKFFS